MANTREQLVDRFFAMSGIGKIQSAIGTPMANADLDTRIKCAITREEVITRRDIRDCRNEDLTDSQVITRLARYTLNITETTPQIDALFLALFLGQAEMDSSVPANEVQNLAYSGSPSAGDFKLRMTLEGQQVTTKAIPYNPTAAQLVDALTAARMRYIHPGDISALGGVRQVETLTIVGTSSGGNLPVTVIATGSVALAGAGKTINVALANLDNATVSAGKVRAALAADVDVAAFFTISGSGADVVATAKLPAANDTLMALSNTAAVGMSAATSANTTAGVDGNIWSTNGVNITFQNRLGKADLPLLEVVESTVAGGSIVPTQVTAGAQNVHTFTRASSRVKARFSFALGYEDNVSSIEKYIDYVVESYHPQASLSTDPSLTVTLLGPWDYDSVEAGLTIPDCVNPTPLRTEECRHKIDGNWESSDVNSVDQNFNDNIPVDRLSAFPYDGIDVQSLLRGKNPTYNSTASVFAAHVDTGDAMAVNNHVWKLAHDERSQAAVEVITHYGMPGNRLTILQPDSKIRFQNNRETFVGTAETAATNVEELPLKETTDPPISGEARIDQSVAFLTT